MNDARIVDSGVVAVMGLRGSLELGRLGRREWLAVRRDLRELAMRAVRRLVALGAALVLGLGASVVVGGAVAAPAGAVVNPNVDNYVPVALENSWQPYLSGEQVAVKVKNGLVEFKGSVASGTSARIMTLPVGARPSTAVYLRVDLSGGAKGRLLVSPSGAVSVSDAGGLSFATAKAFTSLDGVSFLVGSAPALPLVNGWTGAPYSTAAPAAKAIGRVVHLKGAIAGGTTARFTTLPVALRPSATVYLPIDLCDGLTGRVAFTPLGEGFVEASESFSDAQCFTSLDGAKFVLDAPPTPLTLLNGWTGAPFATRSPAASVVGGKVFLRGGIASGTANPVFTLPASMRPLTRTWVDADARGPAKARFYIEPNGNVSVFSVAGEFETQRFTSLEGVSFTLPSAYTELVLENAWSHFAYSDERGSIRRAAYAVVNGVVQFKGMVAAGASGLIATLPASARPASTVYLRLDLCSVRQGRLTITPSGAMTVSTQDSFEYAQCFTSLEGVSFLQAGATALTRRNGWIRYPGTAVPAAKVISGVVHFKGALYDGTLAEFTTLPASMRPTGVVYVPIDLCNGRAGRLIIQPSGDVSVQSVDQPSDARCFTSLDGAKFLLNPPSTPLTLFSAWVGAPFGTRTPAAALVAGKVYLKGAVASGTAITLFNLPSNLRPPAIVFVDIDLCDAKKGSLGIYPSGEVTVLTFDIGAALCFTSLDGVSFAR